MKTIAELTQLFQFNTDAGCFVLSAENKSVGEQYFQQLTESATQNQLKNLFRWDPQHLHISITKKDFVEWQRKLLPTIYKGRKRLNVSQRCFFKCGNNYFTIPAEKETIKSLMNSLDSSARDRGLRISLKENHELGIVEMTEENYNSLQKKSTKAKSIKLKDRNIQYDETGKCYFTTAGDNESLQQLKHKLLKQIKYASPSAAEIVINSNNELNRVEFNEEIYVYIKESKNKVKTKKKNKRILDREFVFDQTRNMWSVKALEDEDIITLIKTIKEASTNLGFDKDLFFIKNGQIEISNNDFEEFKKRYSEKSLSRFKGYGVTFKQDKASDIYYVELEYPQQMWKSLTKLAKFLDVNVTFNVRRNRVVLSAEDYQTWVGHPAIKNSLSSNPNNLGKDEAPKVLKRSKLTSAPAQKAESTKGGISTKYLEGAFQIPIESRAEQTQNDLKALLSKGHVIPFEQLKHTLLPENNEQVFMRPVRIDFQGIGAELKIYTSTRQKFEDFFQENNIVFIRAGRKETALVPTLIQDEKTLIILLMTREEYDEMEKSLGFPPKFRLPSHIKLCVIESCTLKNQPGDQPSSYVRASNIKRAIAYAFAEQFKLNNFILMDDNTEQIQMAKEVVGDDSIQSLFNLFHEYKAQGSICAMLGSFEFYKPIAHPLEANEAQEIEERLGSKIMFIDYKRLRQKLESEQKQLHELVSPCSLWWGEDYFNMLSILKLLEHEEQKGLLGVLPYSVAWHKRNHKQLNKAKAMPHFKLANMWLSTTKEFIQTLTPHQQQVVQLLQNLVTTAIAQQETKQKRFFESLTKDQITEAIQETETLLPAPLENSHFRNGYQHGVKIANCGHPLDVEKLQKLLAQKLSLQAEQSAEYIRGVTEGHQTAWDSLSPQIKAICRGYRDGFLAAKEGFNTDKLDMEAIPALYENLKDFYLQGYKRGNETQWQNMTDVQNGEEVEDLAITMGIRRAESGFDINEAKLTEMIARFGANAAVFEIAYREAFMYTRRNMPENDIILKKAAQLAYELSKSEATELDVHKLDKAALKNYGDSPTAKLYKNTVMNEFNRLRAAKGEKRASPTPAMLAQPVPQLPSPSKKARMIESYIKPPI